MAHGVCREGLSHLPSTTILHRRSELEIQSRVDAVRWRHQRTASQLEDPVVHPHAKRSQRARSSRRRRYSAQTPCRSWRRAFRCRIPPPVVKYGCTPKIALGVCRRRLPLPILSDGAAAVGSSVVLVYSNSKPTTTSRPMPTASPRTCRLAGEVFAPMNAVTSAHAGLALDRPSPPPADAECSSSIARLLSSTLSAHSPTHRRRGTRHVPSPLSWPYRPTGSPLTVVKRRPTCRLGALGERRGDPATVETAARLRRTVGSAKPGDTVWREWIFG